MLKWIKPHYEFINKNVALNYLIHNWLNLVNFMITQVVVFKIPNLFVLKTIRLIGYQLLLIYYMWIALSWIGTGRHNA